MASTESVKNKLKKYGLSKLNSPKRTPNHPTKKGIVAVKEGDNVKIIRFGDQKMGHNYSAEARKSFKARHGKNIAKGKTSAAYWADKFFWAGPSGSKKSPPKSQKHKKGV
jgi:DNA-directed RNA polymerase subunit H (RpoH/RPB5)